MTDEGLSEITGFLLILSLVILFAAVFSAAALPEYLSDMKREHTEDILFRFAGIQEGMDSLVLTNTELSRKVTLTEPLFGSAALMLFYGKPVSYGGVTYHELLLSYEAEKPGAEKLRLTLDSAGVKKNGKHILPSSYHIVVNPENTPEQMETTGVFRIEYSRQGSFVSGGQNYQIFSLRLA